jgi:hypothetical protein
MGLGTGIIVINLYQQVTTRKQLTSGLIRRKSTFQCTFASNVALTVRKPAANKPTVQRQTVTASIT